MELLQGFTKNPEKSQNDMRNHVILTFHITLWHEKHTVTLKRHKKQWMRLKIQKMRLKRQLLTIKLQRDINSFPVSEDYFEILKIVPGEKKAGHLAGF